MNETSRSGAGNTHEKKSYTYHETIIKKSVKKYVKDWYRDQSVENRTKFHKLFKKLDYYYAHSTAKDKDVDLYDSDYQMARMYGNDIIEESMFKMIANWLRREATEADRNNFRDVFSALSAYVHHAVPSTQYRHQYLKFPPAAIDPSEHRPAHEKAMDALWKQKLEQMAAEKQANTQRQYATNDSWKSMYKAIFTPKYSRPPSPAFVNSKKNTVVNNNNNNDQNQCATEYQHENSGYCVIEHTANNNHFNGSGKAPFATLDSNARNTTTMRDTYAARKWSIDLSIKKSQTMPTTTASIGVCVPSFSLISNDDNNNNNSFTSKTSRSADGSLLRGHRETATVATILEDQQEKDRQELKRLMTEAIRAVPSTTGTLKHRFTYGNNNNGTTNNNRVKNDQTTYAETYRQITPETMGLMRAHRSASASTASTRTPFATYHSGHLKTTLVTEYNSHFA